MNLFKAKTTWTNAEFIPLKLCIGAAYLFLGVYFQSYLHDYNGVILAVFAITLLWSMWLWLTKMIKENKPEKTRQLN